MKSKIIHLELNVPEKRLEELATFLYLKKSTGTLDVKNDIEDMFSVFILKVWKDQKDKKK